MARRKSIIISNNSISYTVIIIPLVRRNRYWLELTARKYVHGSSATRKCYIPSDWYRWLHPTDVWTRRRRRRKKQVREYICRKKTRDHSSNDRHHVEYHRQVHTGVIYSRANKFQKGFSLDGALWCAAHSESSVSSPKHSQYREGLTFPIVANQFLGIPY